MSAPALEPADLETLERLCEKGEMILPNSFVFYPLQNLINAGFAEERENFLFSKLVKPTPLGEQVSAIRAALKARLRKPRLKFGNQASA